MLSKSQIKLIKSLSQKKFRNKQGLFVVEGEKGVNEFLNSDHELQSLYTSGNSFDFLENKLNQVEEGDLKKISFLTNPQNVVAVFKIPNTKQLKKEGLILALDGVRDPGNLGTIIRLCDWFGIENLICSTDTVDCYNPKVIQASMGSLARLNIKYLDLAGFIKNNTATPVFGTLLDGKNIYKSKLPESAIIIMGNEANGISEDVEKLLSQKITIPQFGNNRATESLNVATATSIILSEFKRSAFTEK